VLTFERVNQNRAVLRLNDPILRYSRLSVFLKFSVEIVLLIVGRNDFQGQVGRATFPFTHTIFVFAKPNHCIGLTIFAWSKANRMSSEKNFTSLACGKPRLGEI